jgi:hypothetical protein
MEEHFWTSGADNARSTTAANAVMIFPIRPASSRVTISGPICAENRLAFRHHGRTARDAVSGHRHSHLPGVGGEADVPVYKALCASTYLYDDDRWLRLSHQQTIVT